MHERLEKPFLRWQGYSYDGYHMSENFFVVEDAEQIKKVLRGPTEAFKDWLQNIRDASKNKDPIDLMVFYWYIAEGMDKPYKNDITDLLIKDVASENKEYIENLYNLLKAYNPKSKWHWCHAIKKLKESSLAAEWKEKFLALCDGAIGGKRSKTRRNSKNRRNNKSRKYGRSRR